MTIVYTAIYSSRIVIIIGKWFGVEILFSIVQDTRINNISLPILKFTISPYHFITIGIYRTPSVHTPQPAEILWCGIDKFLINSKKGRLVVIFSFVVHEHLNATLILLFTHFQLILPCLALVRTLTPLARK